jgi:ubiquitin-like 1-activating enzyme E1 B
MSTAKRRNAHVRAILGPELSAQLANTNVLLVGAGGIGCELRKWLEVLEDFLLMSRCC